MVGEVVALIQIPNKRLFSRREAAAYLGMHVHTLDREVTAGRIRALKNRGKLKFRLEDLEGYVASLEEYTPHDEARARHGRNHGRK